MLKALVSRFKPSCSTITMVRRHTMLAVNHTGMQCKLYTICLLYFCRGQREKTVIRYFQ